MSAQRRQRTGWIRRWLVRPLAWCLALLAVVAAVAAVVARSAWLERKVRLLVEERAGEYLGRRVDIESLALDLLPPSVVAWGVVVAGEEGEDPFASAARVEVVADLSGLIRRQVRLRSLVVDEPRVRVVRAADGSHNAPVPERRGGGSGGRVTIDQLLVRNGSVRFEEHTLPLDVEARLLDARWASGGREDFELLGTVSAEETTVAVADLEPYLGSVRGTLRLHGGGLEILDARIHGPDLEASARGAVAWRGESRADLELDVVAAGGLLPRLGLTDAVDGSVRFGGGLTWSPESWLLAGTMASRRLVLADRVLSDVTGQLRVGPGSVRVERVRGTYREGSLAADVTVDIGGRSPTIVVRGELARGAVGGVLADQGMPFEGLVGEVGGPFEYRCTAAEPLEGSGWVDLEITAVAPTAAGDLPVQGQAPLLIERGVLSSRAIFVQTPAAEAELSGSYDLAAGQGSFELRAEVSDPRRLLGVLVPVSPGDLTLWRPDSGEGSVDGVLTLTPGHFRARLALDFTDVRATGFSAAGLKGQLALSGAGVERMRLELTRPEAALVVQGRVPFGEAGVGRALSVQVEAASWPWQDVSPWLPWEIPVDGEVSGSVSLDGAVEALDGFVDVRFAEAAIAGLPVDEVEVDLGLLKGRMEVNAVRVRAPAGEAVVTGSLGEEADLRLQAAALTLAAAPFADLVPGSLRGTLDLEARLTGDLERPTVIASLGGRDLAVGDASLGGDGTARLDLEWRDGEVRLDGTLLGLLDVAGGGEADMERFDLRADLATDRIESLVHLAAGSAYPELGGALRGELTASGQWDGSDVRAALTGDHLEVSWAGTELRLLEPYLITLVEDRLRVESLYLGDESGASELFLFGDLPLTADQTFDLRIQAALSSVWAQPFFPDWEIGEGRFEGLGAIRGAADDLHMSGQGELTQSSLLIPGVPGSFREIAGYVLFDPGRIVLDSFHADFAGGTLRAEGTVALPGEEAPALQYQLQASARGVTVRYPPGFVLRGGAEASIVSTAEGRRISGVVELDRAFYLEDVPIGFSQLLQTVFDKQPLDIRETDELLASTELNLLVRGPDALAVRNNVADLDGDIDLAVRGTLARPVVFGAVEVKTGGKLVYSGNEYTVERAVLTFANPFRIEPIIDLVATTELREYDVTLTLAGTLDQLTATVVSDPPLADLDVLALLTAGGDLPGAYDGSSSTASPSEQGVAAGLLYGQAASVVARRFNRLFGLDQFRIDPLTEASGGLESARVTVGQRLSSDLFATYSYDPSRTDIQVLELEWQLNRAVTVIATQNGDGTYALDVRWQKSF